MLEDIQAELGELAILLNSSFEPMSDSQKDLIIELVAMKLQHLSEDKS